MKRNKTRFPPLLLPIPGLNSKFARKLRHSSFSTDEEDKQKSVPSDVLGGCRVPIGKARCNLTPS
jgi:hypothetical protein